VPPVICLISIATLDVGCASKLLVVELNIKVKPFSTPVVEIPRTSSILTFGFGANESAAIAVLGDDLMTARLIVPVVLILALIAILLRYAC
jgi:hypothetical protein